MGSDRRIVEQYAYSADETVEGAILRVLAETGKDPDRPALDDLAPFDEFHIGGHRATVEIAAQMNLRPGMRLLDVGSGVGGPARYFAASHACRVTGIDLSEAFVEASIGLSRRTGLAGQVSFEVQNALNQPYAGNSFDGAYMFHAGMNIADKSALFAELARVLKAGAICAVYDVMRIAPGELSFPLPWASSSDVSFLATPMHYRSALHEAAFEIVAERNRAEFALEALRFALERFMVEGAAAVGSRILMGEDSVLKIRNLLAGVEQGLVAPMEIFARCAG